MSPLNIICCLTTGHERPLVEQELLTLPEHLSSAPGFSGVRVTRSLVLCVCFVDRSPFVFFFCHCVVCSCVVCSSSIYGLYPFGIFKLFLTNCWSFDNFCNFSLTYKECDILQICTSWINYVLFIYHTGYSL